ncbi:hypothetical protein BU17DRAFT_60453 [Hysterangium stoloniferum]|nr:hypothetical protein BU17DRAFT_60453 [Hysterangium stoloniferum]
MHAKAAFSVIVISAVLLISGYPNPAPGRVGHGGRDGSLCSTGSPQCCAALIGKDDANAQNFLDLLGVTLDHITAQFGFQCNPINEGGECAVQTVCCQYEVSGVIILLVNLGINCVSP